MTTGFFSVKALSLLSIAAFFSSSAAAQGYIWADGYQSQDIYRDEPRRVRPVTRQPVLPRGAEKAEKIAVQGRKPQGPLVIAVSIQHQTVKVYDANGLFAESPISSGMAGHSTPMGVFSVIQKNKFHRSNIYSGAPMPYMQRVTWSGIAMHAGVLPGYPASHGCIRMPMAFAMKMWGWTRMGARVVITPGEVSPSDFAHPVLAALVPPAPVASAPTSPNIKTADASNSMVGGTPRLTTDIAADHVAAKTTSPDDVATVASIVAGQAAAEPATEVSVDAEGLPSLPAPAAIDLSDIETPVGDALRASTDGSDAEASKPHADVPDSAATEVTATADVIAAPATIAAQAAVSETDQAKTQPEMQTRDPLKDQTQMTPDAASGDVAPVIAAPLIKRNLPVAIFVSRKDGKIYVRQNFTPLFDMPIQIASTDRALGTHVFTARTTGNEDKKLQWSAVSLPAVARQASAGHDERRRRNAGAVVVAQVATNTPDEALARLTIPADFMTRLGDALPEGSSLVVSDQGITQGETGAGTDFIVRLR